MLTPEAPQRQGANEPTAQSQGEMGLAGWALCTWREPALLLPPATYHLALRTADVAPPQGLCLIPIFPYVFPDPGLRQSALRAMAQSEGDSHC